VGLGNCVKEVPLNRTSLDGRERIAVSELFDGLASDEGICTFVCTDDVAACDDLSMNGTVADPEPHECQLVFVDAPPYPDMPPAFPFDDQLDPAEQELGPAFGAICRPPLGLDEDVDDSVCEPCDTQSDCGTDGATCWNFRTAAPFDVVTAEDGDTTTCLAPCASDDECPVGFACDAVADQASYCSPIEGTCSKCRDHDGDGRGDGRCAQDGTTTPHDCDDTNPNAYLDPESPEHPFPTYCGEQDYNCNGVSDAMEEVGAQAYGAEHCTACFDTCDGPVTNGTKTCSSVPDGSGGDMPACTAECNVDANNVPTHADCNGDISDGCEVPVDLDPATNPQYFIYPDTDGDSYGDKNAGPEFLCDGAAIPDGFVQNNLDCDDTDDAINPDGTEVCDSADNDCDGDVDEDDAADAATWYEDKDGDGVGVTSSTTTACTEPTGFADSAGDCDDSDATVYPGNTETCDGKDNNCIGGIDEGVRTTYYRDADGDSYGNSSLFLGACPGDQPSGYVANSNDCNDSDGSINPGASENDAADCDGVDNDCDGTIDEGLTLTFYADNDADGFGDPNTTEQRCAASNVWVSNDGDCNDSDADTYPGAAEIEGAGTCMQDRDEDGYGASTPAASGVAAGSDCDDALDTTYDGAVEICDVDGSGQPIDSNCDGTANEGCPTGATIGTSLSSTSPVPGTLPSSFETSADVRVECNDGYVMGNVQVRLDPNNKSIIAMRGLCEPFSLTDTNGDGIPDTTSVSDTASQTQYWSNWIGWGVAGDTEENLICTDTPAQVFRSAIVEASSSGSNSGLITEMQLTCNTIDLDMPAEKNSDDAALNTNAPGTTTTFGYSSSGAGTGTGCQNGQVGVGFVTKVVTTSNFEVGLAQFSLLCRTVDLNLR
jgi:hypothetical protein